MGPFFMCSCVLLSPGRFGPLRAEVVVGFRRVRLVQALLSSPSSAGLVPFSVGLRFSFPLPFQGCPFWARFHVLVFALSLFFCVPLFASWLSNFHLIVIFTSSSFPFLFIFISLSGPYCPTLLREGVCVDHLKRCKTSNLLDDVLQWFSNLTLPFWLFHLIFQQKQGGKAFSDYLAQRSYVTEGEATGDAQLCTCR